MVGEMLFNGEYVPRQAARGLMWLALARDGASPGETWIANLYAAARKQGTVEDRAAARVDLERWLKGHPIKLFFKPIDCFQPLCRACKQWGILAAFRVQCTVGSSDLRAAAIHHVK
jgi:hypothetical protein